MRLSDDGSIYINNMSQPHGMVRRGIYATRIHCVINFSTRTIRWSCDDYQPGSKINNQSGTRDISFNDASLVPPLYLVASCNQASRGICMTALAPARSIESKLATMAPTGSPVMDWATLQHAYAESQRVNHDLSMRLLSEQARAGVLQSRVKDWNMMHQHVRDLQPYCDIDMEEKGRLIYACMATIMKNNDTPIPASAMNDTLAAVTTAGVTAVAGPPAGVNVNDSDSPMISTESESSDEPHGMHHDAHKVIILPDHVSLFLNSLLIAVIGNKRHGRHIGFCRTS